MPNPRTQIFNIYLFSFIIFMFSKFYIYLIHTHTETHICCDMHTHIWIYLDIYLHIWFAYKHVQMCTIYYHKISQYLSQKLLENQFTIYEWVYLWVLYCVSLICRSTFPHSTSFDSVAWEYILKSIHTSLQLCYVKIIFKIVFIILFSLFSLHIL